MPPLLFRPDEGLALDAGVANFEMDFEDGGFSTKDVSVVLWDIIRYRHCLNPTQRTERLSRRRSFDGLPQVQQAERLDAHC